MQQFTDFRYCKIFKTPYLCTRNQNSAVMLATPEWIVLCSHI